MSRENTQQAGYDGFAGHVGQTFSESVPSFDRRPSAPAEAPNVLVVLADDLGFSDLGCYGSEISTPALDALADRGIRYRNFHSNPMCSPTRASLLTGRNPHAVGMGHLATLDSGFPGYRGRLHADVATAAEVFRDNGYVTFAVGKWHLSSEEDPSSAADKSGWPIQRGFDQYYGFLEGFTNFHQPARLLLDNQLLDVDDYPDGYYLTDDLTDQAIRMIESAKAADPTKPFFMYFAHGAVHAPLMAKAQDIARQSGRYAAGWDAIRGQRFRRQLRLGVVPAGTELAPRNHEELLDVPAWDSLNSRQQQLAERFMEVYAAMVENVDANLARLLDILNVLGELENTIVIFTSDNGGSKEGGELGTTEYYRTVRLSGLGLPEDHDFVKDHSRLELVGGPRVMAHYPRGWSMVSNTPFRMYKGTTFAGGHQVPFIVSYPDGLPARGELRSQYAHVSQVLPTLMDMIGLAPPAAGSGRPEATGLAASLLPTLTDGDAATTNPEQYYEIRGHRGYVSRRWEALTLHRPGGGFDSEHWYLFDWESDPSQTQDLAENHPERLTELADAWDQAAWANFVYPLDDGTGMHRVPNYWEHPPPPVRLRPFGPSLESWRAKELVSERSFRIHVELDFRVGDEGVLVSHGDQGGGYIIFIESSTCILAYNLHGTVHTLTSQELSSGVAQIEAVFRALGGGTWQIDLGVDGTVVASLDRVDMLSGLSPFQGISVGLDRRSPVLWDLHERHGVFRYTGTLDAVTYIPGELAPDGNHRRLIDKRLTMLRTQ